MRITRCVCTNLSFAKLLDKARDESLSLDQLVERTGACDGCGMCRPYVRETLETGQTVFTRVIVDEPDSGAA
ncbi:MAG: (2Fe-2S)-binding protein [Planctomycetota bacterium]